MKHCHFENLLSLIINGHCINIYTVLLICYHFISIHIYTTLKMSARCIYYFSLVLIKMRSYCYFYCIARSWYTSKGKYIAYDNTIYNHLFHIMYKILSIKLGFYVYELVIYISIVNQILVDTLTWHFLLIFKLLWFTSFVTIGHHMQSFCNILQYNIQLWFACHIFTC